MGLPSSTEVGAVFLSFFVELIIIGFAKVMQKVNGNIAFSSTKPTTNTLKKYTIVRRFFLINLKTIFTYADTEKFNYEYITPLVDLIYFLLFDRFIIIIMCPAIR